MRTSHFRDCDCDRCEERRLDRQYWISLAIGLGAACALVGAAIGAGLAYAQEPVYRPSWAHCPGGWHASGQFCVPNGRPALRGSIIGNFENQTCPGGWHASGTYCLPNGPQAPQAIRAPNGTCPGGWHRSGGACVR